MEGSPDKPGNLIVWGADSPYDELRRDERPFARHMAVAALPGGRVLTGDRYALRLWTPRQTAADSSEPPDSANRDLPPVSELERIGLDDRDQVDRARSRFAVAGRSLTSAPGCRGVQIRSA